MNIKALLCEEPKLVNAIVRRYDREDYHYHPENTKYHKVMYNKVGPEISVTPYLETPNKVIFQFNGWALNIYLDGTWELEDTTGG